MARQTLSSLQRCRILGVDVAAEPFETVVDAALGVLREEERHAVCVCPTGVHGVIEAQKVHELREFLNSVAVAVPDGMPLVRVARRNGFPAAERAFGPDAMWAILKGSLELGSRHFFYGGGDGVARKLADTLRGRLPGLSVAGTYCPPFRPLTAGEEGDIATRINRTGADVVWIGLSTPKQELWASSMRSRLDVKLLCTVGAAFDYHTGSIKRAPCWMQQWSLEWIYRLSQEPRRLWRRYFDIVPKFMILMACQRMGIGRPGKGGQL